MVLTWDKSQAPRPQTGHTPNRYRQALTKKSEPFSKIRIFEKKKRMQQLIEKRKKDLIALCQALNIKRLYAFGSVVSDKFRDDSDIDFLISFADNLSVEEYTQNYFTLLYKLRELFDREIDIVTERTLSNPYLIESINESKQLIYEA